MSTSLLMITRDPFEPWKHAERVLRRARKTGFEIVVVLDSRSSTRDASLLGAHADQVLTWTSPGYAEDAFRFTQACTGDFVLRIDDDEEPSNLLWQIAGEPPQPARYGIPVLPILGNRLWRRDVGFQERLFYRPGWEWVGGFRGHSESAAPSLIMGTNPGVLIWHYLLDAPRIEREEKAARYASLDPDADHLGRLIYEDHPEGFVDLGEHIAKHLPK